MADYTKIANDDIAYKPPMNYKLPTMLLDAFTKVWCIDRRAEDLEFMCGQCPFEQENGKCAVKLFKCEYCPEYGDFGSMCH